MERDFLEETCRGLISAFLIEQDVQQTLEIADWAYVLENGRVILTGKSKNLHPYVLCGRKMVKSSSN